MKQPVFVTLFIGTHILFIFIQIHKHSSIIQQSYVKQNKEIQKNNLLQEKQLLTQKLYALKDHNSIKKFATNHLKMKKIKLNQIKKIA